MLLTGMLIGISSLAFLVSSSCGKESGRGSAHEHPHDCGSTDTKFHSLNDKCLDRAYRVLEKAAQSRKIPGAVILVSRHGIPMELRGFGRMRLEADSPTIQPDTIFLVASVTKPVTVSAVMLLVERGKISLDDKVASIIISIRGR